MISKQTRVAVVFRRLGPYHHARLNAAGKLVQIFGVEACSMDDTYAWEKVDGAASFTRITLTDRCVQSRLWRKELCRKMWQVLQQAQPQVVAIPGWSFTDALSALSWCLATKTPAVMMSDSTAWDERRLPWKEWVKVRIIRMCIAGFVAGARHADYLSALGMPRKRIFLGYDAVDNSYFEKRTAEIRCQPGEAGTSLHGPEKAESKTRFSLPEKYFLASARFIEKKNLSRLLQAYARYRELAVNSELRTPNSELWHLVLLGDGPLKSDLCHLISDLGLQHCVLLSGFKQYDELPMYYGLASAFIHASTTEQWGLVVNEAMASGLPVLVSNRCGCAMDLVKDGVNGFTFDPFNLAQLAQLMFQISAFQPFRLSAFGSASGEIISHWGPERFASGLKAAVDCALKVGSQRVGVIDRLLLKALIAR